MDEFILRERIGPTETTVLKKILSQKVEIDMKKPIQHFLSKPNNHLPIIMIAYNRPYYMKQSLRSLLNVRGVEKKNIEVIQDDKNKDVAQVAIDFGIKLKQHVQNRTTYGPDPDPGIFIAQHYAYALRYAFEKNTDAPAIIIVEDDLLYSPDFLEYLEYNSVILEDDESTFLLSAWNDNGQKNLIRDPYRLHRTEYFPGLGWLLPRKLYENELQKTWPFYHWDHWLRDPVIHKGRDCIYPEVSRTYHIGEYGTFMNESLHSSLFKNIGYNTNSKIRWSMKSFSSVPSLQIENKPIKPYWRVFQSIYESYHFDFITTSIPLINMDSIEKLKQTTPVYGTHYMIRYTLSDSFEPISNYFGIWPDSRRSSYKGIHDFYYHGHHLMLINAEYSSHVLPELIIHSQRFQEFVESQQKKEDEKLNKHKRDYKILMYFNIIILFLVIFFQIHYILK